MEDRIEINGVWYVREEHIEEKEDFTFEIIESREIMIETESFIMEGVVLEDNGKTSMPSIDIKYKNGMEGECWDREKFLVGLAQCDRESLHKIRDYSEELKSAAIYISRLMVDKGWI